MPTSGTCPEPYPNIGTKCTGAAICKYGQCSSNTRVYRECVNDVWANEPTDCADGGPSSANVPPSGI